MNELINALRDYLVRDALYVVGGSSVCLAGLYALDRLPTNELSTPWIFLGVGISYGVGFAVQEVASLIRLVRYAPTITPGRVVQRLYSHLTRTEWIPASYELWLERLGELKRSSDIRSWAQLQRIIVLKQVGITLGSNWLLASLFLGARWFWRGQELPDFVLALSTLLAACALIIVSITKNAQGVQYVCHQREI